MGVMPAPQNCYRDQQAHGALGKWSHLSFLPPQKSRMSEECMGKSYFFLSLFPTTLYCHCILWSSYGVWSCFMGFVSPYNLLRMLKGFLNISYGSYHKLFPKLCFSPESGECHCFPIILVCLFLQTRCWEEFFSRLLRRSLSGQWRPCQLRVGLALGPSECSLGCWISFLDLHLDRRGLCV